jgi:hypothetical protein
VPPRFHSWSRNVTGDLSPLDDSASALLGNGAHLLSVVEQFRRQCERVRLTCKFTKPTHGTSAMSSSWDGFYSLISGHNRLRLHDLRRSHVVSDVFVSRPCKLPESTVQCCHDQMKLVICVRMRPTSEGMIVTLHMLSYPCCEQVSRIGERLHR